MSKIEAKIVADSINQQGDRLTSVLVVMPRIIIAEINTHRMLSKNTSSSRAIPFKKMVESVQNDPFVPIAWQKHHSGMQGNEYITDKTEIENCKSLWMIARDHAIEDTMRLNSVSKVTKQLCNRLLEPFMWTTMLITGSKEGWDNFFNLRCPQYKFEALGETLYKSKKEVRKASHFANSLSDLEWLQANKGQAEIHLMDLAEKIYDAMNESTPKQLKPMEWHIPFGDKINIDKVADATYDINDGDIADFNDPITTIVKISTAMAARTSYTVVGDEKEIDYKKMIELHYRLLELHHMSPFEHCARAMSDKEYASFIKGNLDAEIDADGYVDISTHINNHNSFGWCRNFKGFVQYRHLIEES